MSRNRTLAELFDKLAEHVEAEAEAPAKTASAPPENPRAKQIRDSVRTATGTDLPAGLAEKIAQDPELLEHVQKLAEIGSAPARMGVASDLPGSAPISPNATKSEKLASAYQRWGNAITGR